MHCIICCKACVTNWHDGVTSYYIIISKNWQIRKLFLCRRVWQTLHTCRCLNWEMADWLFAFLWQFIQLQHMSVFDIIRSDIAFTLVILAIASYTMCAILKMANSVVPDWLRVTVQKKPVTTMLTYPWKCTVLHCNHLGNTWKPLVLMT